jgi:hypothetical protein
MDNTLIIELANARFEKEKVKKAMKEALDLITKSEEYTSLEIALNQAMQDEADALTKVRDAAFAEYGKDGNKHPHEEVTIKEFTHCEIVDYERAREWCLKNFTPALTLDDKIFVNVAKKGMVPEDLVKEYSEFKAQVTQDLSAYLEKVGVM